MLGRMNMPAEVNRRHFLQTTALAAALPLAALGADAPPAAKGKPKVGCLSWCFHDFSPGVDPEPAIDIIGELGFDGNGNGIFYLSSGGVGTFTSTGSDDASLAAAFARNPGLRLYVGVNYFDLNAPFYAAEFTLAHLNVSPEVRAHNITVGHFEAGQMTYVDNKALVKLQADLARFVNEAASPARK